ncbi:MAG: hypothetical protein IT186_17910 [Acidobacteria bacterium]|nr:hypothetical protein [Acidobacteriota bacterium]
MSVRLVILLIVVFSSSSLDLAVAATELKDTPQAANTSASTPTPPPLDSSSLPGTYVNSQNGNTLELAPDGTFSFRGGDKTRTGTYKIEGQIVSIRMKNQFKVDHFRFTGDALIGEKGGSVYQKPGLLPSQLSPAARIAAEGGPSMKQLEEWVKHDLPRMADDHIITKTKDRTFGMTYRMPKAELSECVLTVRQEFRFDDMEDGQTRTATLTLKDLDLANLKIVSEPPAEGFTKNKPSYEVLLSALHEGGKPFRVQTKGLGVDKTDSSARERVRVREESMGRQVEANLRRAALLCGAADSPLTQVASTPQITVTAKAVAAAAGPGSTGNSKTMTNSDVIDLAKAGLSDLVIANAIRQSPERDFDLSPQGLVALKKAKVSDSLIVAMQGAPATQIVPPTPAPTKAPMYDPSLSRSYAADKAAATLAATGCMGIEAMGLYKNDIFDRAMGGGVTEWLAKIRNNTPVTKVVVFSWRDQYGEEKASQVQIRGGDIASVRLDMTEAKFIAPVKDLALKSCQ